KKSVQATDHITWIHGSSRVFHRRGANVKEERFKVTKNSSLLLENIQASLAGDYTVKIYDDEGNLVFHNSQKLCVIVLPIPEAVSNTCEAVWPTLGCTVGGPAADAADAAVSWHRNGILLPGFESKTLPLKPRMFNHGDWYTCTVENVISNKVQPQQCSGKQELELWGLNKWLMVGLLSGGGALVLVLIIVCIICICSHCRRRKERDSGRNPA
uniref:Ig-like domain-containing protein n=1 Tax=Denticeps clupeoides TaxID=299321 RepID=A0AAY4EKU6_9TELE